MTNFLTGAAILVMLLSLSLPGLGRAQLMAKRSIRHSYYQHEARLQTALDETEETQELDRLLTTKRP